MNKLKGFAVVRKKTHFLDKLVEIDNISYALRVYIACYFLLSVFSVYVALNYGFLGLFLTGIGSLLFFYRVPFMTLVSFLLITIGAVTVLLDITGLGAYLIQVIDWLMANLNSQG